MHDFREFVELDFRHEPEKKVNKSSGLIDAENPQRQKKKFDLDSRKMQRKK